jgi:hypothetical protein
MKNLLSTALFLVCIFLSSLVFGQTKVAIYDEADILDAETSEQLKARLLTDSIFYDNTIDYSKKCSHHYAELFIKNDLYYVQIKDCKDNEIGIQCMGNRLHKMSSDLKSFLMSFYIKSILFQEEEEKMKEDVFVKNEHDSRYFFSPSAFNLRKGELYYNSIYFALHDIQYGFTDNFSLGMGTSIAGFPIYFTPKVSFKLNEKNRLAIGDMAILGTYGPSLFANLAYLTYTYGSSENNFSIGLGHFYTGNNDLSEEVISQPIYNLSALIQINNYIYFTTENYYIHNKTTRTAEHYDPLVGFDYEEDYVLSDNFIFGFSGFRIINKNKDVISWQFGLAYFIRFIEDMPYKYSSDEWDADYPDAISFPVPFISYTQKFGKKY